MALGSVCPDYVVRRYELDRSTALQHRLSLAQPAIVAHERAGSERRVELVT